MAQLNIGVIVGSARKDSINRKLAKALQKIGADSFSFHEIQIDDLPIFNQDLEPAPPPAVARLKSDIQGCDALLIITPEHNRSIPTLLKNAIDWGSRPPGKSSWVGKPLALAGTSPGGTGTMSAQLQLRQVLGSNGCAVLGGSEMYIKHEAGVIDDQNDVTNPKTKEFFQKFLKTFGDFAAKFKT